MKTKITVAKAPATLGNLADSAQHSNNTRSTSVVQAYNTTILPKECVFTVQ